MTIDAAAYGTPPPTAPVTRWAPKCWQCGNRIAEYLTEPYSIRCKRCKAQNRAGATLVGVTT